MRWTVDCRCWELQDQYINTAFMGFPAGHPALVTALNGLRDRILSNPQMRIPTAGSYETLSWATGMMYTFWTSGRCTRTCMASGTGRGGRLTTMCGLFTIGRTFGVMLGPKGFG